MINNSKKQFYMLNDYQIDFLAVKFLVLVIIL